MQLLSTVSTIVISLIAAAIIFSMGFGIGYQYNKLRIIRTIEEATKKVKESTPLIPERKDVPEYAQIVNGIRYNTLDAKCIAQGQAFLGWTWLMQTNNRNFFFLHLSSLIGNYVIVPLEKDAAIQAFTTAVIHEVKFEDAFPDVEIKDA